MQKFTRVLASGLLKMVLFGAALTAAVTVVFASPNVLKQSFADSNLYEGLLDNVFASAQKELEKSGEGDVALQPEVQAAAAEALNPELLKNSTESFLDGIYRWLNGEVDLPDFHIDLTAARDQFAASVGQAAAQRVDGLPECTLEQLQALDPEADAFSIACRPPGLTGAMASEQTLAKLDEQEFLKEPVITADTFVNKEDGTSPFQEAEAARSAFAFTKSLPWLLLAIGALLSVSVVFLHETRRKGLKSVGITLAGTGVFLLLTTWLMSFLFGRAAQSDGVIGRAADNEFQSSILAALQSINSVVGRTLLWWSLSYVVIGVAVLLVLHFTKPKEPSAEATKKESKATEELPAKPEEEEKKTA